MSEDDVLKRIKELLDFKHWSVYRLSKESGLAYSSLNNLFHRNTCPTVSTLIKICDGFQISLSDFFAVGRNPLRNETLSEEQQLLLNQYDSLSKKDRELLQAYIKGLKKQV